MHAAASPAILPFRPALARTSLHPHGAVTPDLFDGLDAANDTAPDRPHANCYWVKPGVLMAGEYPGAADPLAAQRRLADIAACGVRHFVDLTESHELASYRHLLPALSAGLDRPVAHERWAIRDVDVPHSADYTRRILDRIDALIAVGAVPYVHCWGGVGRTGTIIGCWLVRHGATGEEALSTLANHWSTVAKRRRFPRSPETDAQRRYVLDWARKMEKMGSDPI